MQRKQQMWMCPGEVFPFQLYSQHYPHI
jgi:hypothetical protein